MKDNKNSTISKQNDQIFQKSFFLFYEQVANPLYSNYPVGFKLG